MKKREALTALIFIVFIAIMLWAFWPGNSDNEHYLLRSLGESGIIFSIVYCLWQARLMPVFLYGFLLSLNNLYDELTGNYGSITLVEWAFGSAITVVFSIIIKNRISKWMEHRK